MGAGTRKVSFGRYRIGHSDRGWFTAEVDKVLMVYAPCEVRIARAIERDSSSRELIEQRIRSQMDDEVKRRQADFVIVNDGEKTLIPQVRELLASL